MRRTSALAAALTLTGSALLASPAMASGADTGEAVATGPDGSLLVSGGALVLLGAGGLVLARRSARS